ncbi:MAG: hypothetical protein JO002_03060 [Burkholderiaceae bacterium]|nr:hypothetical protein [Burkholderiaceae bacterium]
MFRSCFALLIALMLAAYPLLGLAAPAPACSHCSESVTAQHCHQHTASADQCRQCAGCAACNFPSDARTEFVSILPADVVKPPIAYFPAHFYRLSMAPLERPPSALPA